jgi:hypothetical protein
MDQVLQTFSNIVGDILLFVSFMAALLVGLLIAAARMPADNPLRRILHAVCQRVGLLLGAAVAIPVLQPFPFIDIASDVAIPALFIWSLLRMFVEIAAIMKDARASSVATPHIEIQARTLTEEPSRLSRDLQLSGRKDKATSQLPQ